MKPVFIAAACAAALAGCATTPTATPPSALTSPPASWSVTGLGVQPAPNDWWTVLGSPELNALVSAALARNTDLKAAEANLRAAQAVVREARATQMPLGGVGADGRRQRVAALSQPLAPGSPRRFEDQSIVEISGELSWEIDLAGRLAAANRAAKADAEEARWLSRQVAHATIAATVRAFAEHQAAQQQQRLLDARIQQLSLIARRLEIAHQAGATARSDAAAAEETLQALSAQRPELEVRRRNAARRLAVLTGQVPDPQIVAAARVVEEPQTLDAGDPREMLRRRPDVAAAEQRMAGALARAGVARADLYPRITLVGLGGLAAAPGDLDQAGASAFSIGPRLSWGVFDLGRIKARIALADAQSDVALAEWEGTVLKALEEADGALDAWDGARRAAAAAGRAEAAAQESRRLARARRDVGTASALDEARAEFNWLSAQSQAQDARARRLDAWINAQMALGSGFGEGPSQP
ncbi:MAG: efflux transporter outer membrane subunit [Phenylobacterium sp.]|nr:efflux transporter outer membrane subunit [Phenylobacterium sp.]